MPSNRIDDDAETKVPRNPSDKQPPSKQSLEELIKSNVALWFLGALAAGFSAGIAAVKWSDERYQVAAIPIAEKNSYVRAQTELVELRKAYQDMQAKEEALKEVVARQNILIGTLKGEVSHRGRTDMSPSDAPAAVAVPATAPQPGGKSTMTDSLGGFSKVSITVTYVKRRAAEANLTSAKLGPYFSQVQLQACESLCGHDTRINYGFNLTASDALRLAKALQKWGVSGFEEPLISRGTATDTIYVYLED
jgi:hypothetical protein